MARRRRIVVVRVRDAQAATGTQLARLELQLVAKLDQEVEHDLHRLLVRAKGEDLRADVRVEADQVEARMAQRLLPPPGARRPDSIEKPNFESSCPVEMWSCVSGLTPGEMRSMTGVRLPSGTTECRSSNSWEPSMTIVAPARYAASTSSRLLLLPRK